MKTPRNVTRLAAFGCVGLIALAGCSDRGGSSAAPVVALSAVDGLIVYELVRSSDPGPTLNGCPTRGNGARSAVVESFPIFLVISADAPGQQSIATMQLELENAEVLDAGDGEVNVLSETSTIITWRLADETSDAASAETRSRSVRVDQKNKDDVDFIPGDVAVRINGGAVTTSGGAASAPEQGETVWVSTIDDLCL